MTAAVRAAVFLAIAVSIVGASSPLDDLASQFMPAYSAAQQTVLAKADTLVLVRLKNMTLVRNGEIAEQAYGIPQIYFLASRVVHVPFTLYLMLSGVFDQPLPDPLRKQLQTYQSLLNASIPDLSNYNDTFTPLQLQQQAYILQESLVFVQKVFDLASAPSSLYASYRSTVAEDVLSLADVCGASQVDAMHKVMMKWQQILSADEWNRLIVIIAGSRQPRQEYTATQYFNALFPAKGNSLFPGESDRVFYIEELSLNITDTAFLAEREQLAALILDSRASTALFNNPRRLSVDVMADGARRRIEELNLGQ